MGKVKVAIAVTIEVDADGWERDYGVSGSGLREDVKAYVCSLINESSDGNMKVVKYK